MGAESGRRMQVRLRGSLLQQVFLRAQVMTHWHVCLNAHDNFSFEGTGNFLIQCVSEGLDPSSNVVVV